MNPQMQAGVDWSRIRNFRDEMVPRMNKTEQPVDPDISYIVGRPIRANDPRLISLVVKWKEKMSKDSDGTDNYAFLTIPEFVKEVKQVFNAKN